MSTQFLEAVKKGDRAAVDQMLDADPSLASAKDPSGISAVLLAHYYGKADVAAALLSRGPALDVFEAATAGDARRVAALVDADAALANAVAGDGYSPLGLAAFFKRRPVVQALLERGSHPAIVEPFGEDEDPGDHHQVGRILHPEPRRIHAGEWLSH